MEILAAVETVTIAGQLSFLAIGVLLWALRYRIKVLPWSVLSLIGAVTMALISIIFPLSVFLVRMPSAYTLQECLMSEPCNGNVTWAAQRLGLTAGFLGLQTLVFWLSRRTLRSGASRRQ
jgi:hypothetical protein